jgi:N-dimethylarginine dimethylaminohydrolase
MVSIHNEWSALKEVVLGDATNMYPPHPGTVVPGTYLPAWARALEHVLYAVRRNRPVPRFVTRRFSRELAALGGILRENDVAVSRPSPVHPLPGEPPGLSQVFARDPAMVIGNRLILARQRAESLRKEIRGFSRLLARLGAEAVPIIDTRAEDDIFLEGGDVLVDEPYVFVGTGRRATNEAGVRWLRRTLGSRYQVVSVPLADPNAFHLDTCLTIVGPHLAVAHPPALQLPLPPPLCDYTLVPVDARTYRQLGVNLLVVRPHFGTGTASGAPWGSTALSFCRSCSTGTPLPAAGSAALPVLWPEVDRAVRPLAPQLPTEHERGVQPAHERTLLDHPEPCGE